MTTDKKIGIVIDEQFTRIFSNKKGMLYDDLSIVCWNNKTKEIILTGSDAKKIEDKIDNPLQTIWPISNENITDLEIFINMINSIIEPLKNEFKNASIIFSKINFSGENNELEMEILKIFSKLNIKNVQFIDNLTLVALGSNINLSDEYGTILINISYNHATIAVIGEGKIIQSKTTPIAEKFLNNQIRDLISEKNNAFINDGEIERIKITLGSIIKLRDSLELSIDVIDKKTLEKRKIKISDNEIRKIFVNVFSIYKNMITSVLEKSPVHIRTGIIKNGIRVSGELLSTVGIKDFFQDFFDFPTKIAKNKSYEAIDGTMKI